MIEKLEQELRTLLLTLPLYKREAENSYRQYLVKPDQAHVTAYIRSLVAWTEKQAVYEFITSIMSGEEE